MCATYSTISVLMKLDDALHNQCVDAIKWHTPTHWWWSVSFNFINSLMVECIIQFHQHTDGGVYHSISLTHWWWSVSVRHKWCPRLTIKILWTCTPPLVWVSLFGELEVVGKFPFAMGPNNFLGSGKSYNTLLQRKRDSISKRSPITWRTGLLYFLLTWS
jgi:hypothetical protein